MKAKTIISSWPFWFGLILGIFFLLLPVIGTYFTYFPGDLGDARFNNYLLEHAYHFITGQAHSLWNAPFMYPEENVITYSDNLIGTAPIYSLFRIVGLDREMSFQFWFLALAILNYTCCYFFLKSVFKNKYSAVLGALVFAFALSLASQIGHAQTFPRFPIPLVFWMIYLFSLELKPVYFFGALFFTVYELYCGLYLGLLLAIPTALMVISILLLKKSILLNKIKNIKWVLTIMGSGIINCLLSLPLLIPYMQRAEETGFYGYANVFNSLPTIKSYFSSVHGSLFWDFLRETTTSYPAWWDHQIFPGGIAIISMCCFTVFFLDAVKNKTLRSNTFTVFSLALFITGFVTFCLFIRIHHFSLYKVLYALPGFGSLRSLTRVINIELIFFAFAIAFVFDKIQAQKSKSFSTCAFILIAALFISDNYLKESLIFRTNKKEAQERVNALVQKMNGIPPNSIVSYEPQVMTDPCIYYQIDGMLAAQALHLKSINGYSATSPIGYDPFWGDMTKEKRIAWLKLKNHSNDFIYSVH
jgi:hypothetical protein